MELKISAQARGTRILALGKAVKYRAITDTLVKLAKESGAEEIVIPCIEPLNLHSRFTSQLYTFTDPLSQQALCLHPDGTSVCREIANTVWRNRLDLKLFYVTKCWRHGGPTVGNTFEFTQFGYELLNSKKDKLAQEQQMTEIAMTMVAPFASSLEMFKVRKTDNFQTQYSRGFEIRCDYLGAQRGKVCVGGPYKGGYGFEMSIERLMLL